MIRPDPSPATEPFWAAARQGKLLLKRCPQCHHWLHPEAPDCPCGAQTLEWKVSSGRGRLVTFTTTRRANLPWLAEHVPFTVLLVRLEEGVQLVSGIAGEADGLRCGDQVEVWFDWVDDSLALPRFRSVPK